MPTITVVRNGRRWLILPAWSVNLTDPTGFISFHCYSRHEAEILAKTVGVIIGDRPIGPLATLLAKELLLHEPAPDEKWTAEAGVIRRAAR